MSTRVTMGDLTTEVVERIDGMHFIVRDAATDAVLRETLFPASLLDDAPMFQAFVQRKVDEAILKRRGL